MNTKKQLLPALICTLAFLPQCANNSSDTPSINGLSFPLMQEGPYNTGYQTWEITYRPAPNSEERTIPVHLWYPTTAEHDYQQNPPTQSPTYAGLFNDLDTIIDATPAPAVYPKGFPLLAYSHGHLGLAGGSYRLMRFFASHGWAGIAVGHIGNRLIDGDEASRVPLTHWHHRPLDVSEALNALENLPATHALAGKVNTTKVLLAGHSRGSYTTWATAGSKYDIQEIQRRCDEDRHPGGCADEDVQRFEQGFRDPRIAAILPSASSGQGEFFDGVRGRDNLPIPALLMTATDDPVGAASLFEQVNLPGFIWIDIEGGCHELFNLGCGFTDDTEKFPIVTTYSLAFGRHHILDDGSPDTTGLLNGTLDVSPHVTFMKQEP